MCCSGCASASRCTRLSSVPIAHDEPGGRGLDGLDDELGRARPGRPWCTTSWVHSGCTSTWTPGTRSRTSSTHCAENRPCTEQCPFHRIIRASRSCSAVRPPFGLVRVPHHAVARGVIPSSQHRGVAAEVLVGQEEHLGVGLLRRTPTPARPRRCDDVQTAPPLRPQNALMSARGVHVGHGYDGRRRRRRRPARPRRPRPGASAGHVGHRAAGGEVGQDHLLRPGR